ncbi:MAG: type II toxin-antitoxin system VapC family toxin [Candidatus Nezhaarchaeota archaeon]|nr:type II toxin-antitoxin system VapC family toxin [Candidatus Nezhaarchaeota archaeon]
MKLLDTSILVENIRMGVFEPGYISVITLMEVLRGVKPEKRDRVKKLLEESFEVLPLSNEVILKYCELYDRLKQRGEVMPDADMLIAATAIVNDMELITMDRDFERVIEMGLRLEIRRR